MIKDWKKITGKSEWKKGNIFPILEVRKNMSGSYQVNLFRGSGATTIIGAFKTKSQALKFAKAYMRKH